MIGVMVSVGASAELVNIMTIQNKRKAQGLKGIPLSLWVLQELPGLYTRYRYPWF